MRDINLKIKVMKNQIETLSQELQNELKDYNTDFVGIGQGELYTTSEYDLLPETIERIESELNIK